MFSLGIAFSTVLRTLLDLHFGVILGGLGATILPLGCPWRPLEPLLDSLGPPLVSLGPLWDPLALSKRLWVGLVLTL